MSEIKVGEYIRTKYGNIEKVKYISKYDDGDIHINTMRGVIYYRPREILKHSKNIVNLIEVGDIVNKEKVKKIYKSEQQQYIVLETRNIFTSQYKDIKTILTHEQYEKNCYKLDIN